MNKQRYTFPNYEDWVRSTLRGWICNIKEIKSEREYNKAKIKRLREQIKTLQLEIKNIKLPKKPLTDKNTYKQKLRESKEEALKKGYEWVEPE